MDAKHKRGRPRKPRPPGLSGELGLAVEARRKGLGLSAEELGEAAGLGTGTVIRLERGGQSPTLDTVLAVAHALGLSGAELLASCPSWKERPSPKG